MNKLLLTLAMFLATMTAGAQENVNRMVVHQKGGAVKTYEIENVDSVTFGKSGLQGEVTVTVMAAVGTKAYGTITMPEGCKSADVALVPNDGSVSNYSEYIKTHSTQHITITPGTWSYSTLEPSAKYIVAAQAYDNSGAVVSVGTAELNPGDGSVVDLGDGANTYIVPAKGKYSFVPKHVDGSLIRGISNVDWIWSTKAGLGSGQNLISNITCDDNGRVSFESTGKKGSVVLAAFDASNKVLWTWLIWCTDQPEVMTYENGVQFMDRNLGATSANPDDNTSTWGLLWQWGRPTPFFSGYAENEWKDSDAFNEARSWTVVNDKYDFKWGFVLEGRSMADAIAAPMTFFSDDNSCDWNNTVDLTLWSTKKTNYDPSPAGYRLPSSMELAVLGSMELSPKNKGYSYTYNGNTAWWPSAGSGREFNTGCNIIGDNCCYVWTATATYTNDFLQGYSDEPFAYRMCAGAGNIYTESPGNRAFAHSIRCVVDER